VHELKCSACEEVLLEESRSDLKTLIYKPIQTWKESIFNDFEYSVFKKYPSIRSIKEQLYLSGAVYASLSGTGSAVYGIFEEHVKLPILEQSNKVLYC